MIFALTAMLTISGLVYLWFINPLPQVPYLRWLLGILIAEVIGTIVILARRGIRYLPDARNDRSLDDTNGFMERFIAREPLYRYAI